MEVVNGKDVVCLFTSSFAFVFFPFFFSSYIMKYSFLVTLSQPVIWQGDISCMALMVYWEYCFHDHMTNIYVIRFLWFVHEMMRRSWQKVKKFQRDFLLLSNRQNIDKGETDMNVSARPMEIFNFYLSLESKWKQ